MLLPALVAVIYKESSGGYFLVTSLISALVGFMIVRKSPKNKMFYTREGFITVALSWIVLSVVGAVPFVISGTIPNFIMHYLKRFLVLRQQELVFYPMWNHCHVVCCFGVVLPIGLVAWVCWYLSYPYCRW